MQNLIISSPSFAYSGLIPIEHTGYGEDRSPELQLSELDPVAKSLVITLDDLDHPIKGYNHWVIWNIPPTQTIPGGIPAGETVSSLGGAVQGRGYGKNRYAGPKPPFNWSHKYVFTVYALDTMLDLPASSRKKQLLRAMQGHVLQKGRLSGYYR